MRPENCHGFTLIETVISLVLLSLITLIGYHGLVFGLEQWQKGHLEMQRQYDYHQAMGWMRDKLGSAEKVRRIGKDDQTYLFDGTTQSVEFVARYDRTHRSGLYVSRIYLDPENHRLFVSYYLHHPDVAGNPGNNEPQGVTLLSNVSSAQFSYYGRQLGSSKRGWHPSWPEQNSLPQLLRLDIETEDGERHRSLVNILTSNNV